MKKHILIFFLFLTWIFGTFQMSAQNEMLDYEKLAQLPVEVLWQKAEESFRLDHMDTVMGYYTILAGKYRASMDKSEKYLCAMACRSVGLIYYQKENYIQAFEFYLKGMKISEENGFDDLLPVFYNNIGNIYSVLDDRELAIKCYEEGIKMARKQGNATIEIKLLVNITGMCCYANRMEEAKIYYAQMMQFANKDSIVEYFGYLNKGLMLTSESRFDSAVFCYKRLLGYVNQNKFEAQFTSSVYVELAKLYEKMGQKDSALHYFERNIHFTKENHIFYTQVESMRSLAELYKEKGNHEKSLYYKNCYLEITDSLFNAAKFNKIKSAQFFYELNKNYHKIEQITEKYTEKELQLKMERKVLLSFLLATLIFITFSVVFYLQKKRLNEAYKELFERSRKALMEEEHSKKQTRACEEAVEACEEKAEAEIKNATYSVDRLTDEQRELILCNINQAMENIDEICNSEFGLERLSALIHSNSRYVSQVINDTYGQNVRTFINERRIKEAQLRLVNTQEYGNYTIKAIAEGVGYKSQANFIATFKKVTGITPSIYQKIAKDSENRTN